MPQNFVRSATKVTSFSLLGRLSSTVFLQEPLDRQLVIRLPLDEILSSLSPDLWYSGDMPAKKRFEDTLRRIGELDDTQVC